MKITFLATALFSLALARPVVVKPLQLAAREVPQEHSREKFLRIVKTLLDLDNPDGILDTVFGLLGNAVRPFSYIESLTKY